MLFSQLLMIKAVTFEYVPCDIKITLCYFLEINKNEKTSCFIES